MSTPSSAVVTGGARGIGRAIAELLVARDYQVVVSDVDGAAARRTAEEIGAVAGMAHDVREEAAHTLVADEALRHGRLVAWFNNAGVGDDGTLARLPSAAVERLVAVNLLGTVWGTRAALAAFAEAGGDIVNVASLSGLGPVPGLSAYAATKAAVVSLSMSVNAETPPGVRVHALCPDGVDTDMVAGMDPDGVAKKLVHSGGGLLRVDTVAAAAVGLLDSSRVVRTLPAWRGGLIRVSALTPSRAVAALPALRALGDRAIRRRAARR